MASSARIEELERKFNENPRRYFAPLANEYRKAGDLEQAIAICRTYVPQQPAHMSGHIVFGQALFEAGEHEEARGVFEAALALDPENLIALRHLGDIARERGEMSAARTWYQRVLDADPRNDEVATLLSALDGPGGHAPTGDVPTWAEINPERTLELPPALLESATRETVVAAAPQDVRGAAPSTARNAGSTFAPTLQPPPPAVPGAAWAHETPVVPEDIPGPRLVDIEPLEMPAGKAPERAAPAQAAELPSEPPPGPPSVDSEMAAAGPGAPLWAEPDATPHDAMPMAPADGLEPMEFVAPPHPQAAPAPPGEAVAHERADGETPAVFVTETMAELYLQQGFRDEALSVYRQLLAQNPADVTLRERVEQLEQIPQRRDAGPVGAGDSVATEFGFVPGVANSPTIRAFFAALATRKWHGGDNGTTAPTVETETRSADAPAAVVDSHADSAPSHADPEFEATVEAHMVVRDNSEGLETIDATIATESSPAETAGPDTSTHTVAATDSGVAAPRISGGSGLQIMHEAHEGAVDPIAGVAGAASAGVIDDFGYTGATAIAGRGVSEFDVASYDAADMSSTVPLAHHPAGPEAVPEVATAVEGETSAGAPTAPAPPPPEGPTEPASVQTSPEVGDPNGSGPTTVARKPMQTGSVNVLFPQGAVRPTDETAAATLSSAFGGPTQTGAASVTGRPARPASNELSLDSIFRESPPPTEPRREASAFSFDQFFTDATGPTSGSSSAVPRPGAAPPRDSTSDASGADTLSDAEQFSNWLAGLKKK